MAKRKKRKKPHKGVTLIKPDPEKRMGWRARVVDVDTCKVVNGRVALSSGKTSRVTLPSDIVTVEQREAWAVVKAGELAKRIAQLEGGAPRATGSTLTDTIEIYYTAHPKLRGKTLTAYRGATAKLLKWAEGEKLVSGDKLTRAGLLKFRAMVETEPKYARAAGGKRGAVKETDEPRSTYSINRELRGVRTVLGYLVDADQFPKLTHDDLRRALKRLPVAIERVDYLKAAQLQKLLEAALDHDAEVFSETREEHRGDRPIGTTPRYTAIAPFTAFVLLSGCRLGEALALDWDQVDLDALDHDGKKVGEIHLTGAATKTHRARTIGLEVSPALRDMLAEMHEMSGGVGSVFGMSAGEAEAAGKRLRAEYSAPKKFTWQALRRTCGTFLTNAPGIFGAASAYRSAKQLGHSVQVAEKHYLGVVRGIPTDARTLEAAMQIEDVLSEVIDKINVLSQPSIDEARSAPRRRGHQPEPAEAP